jgi:hypothetical protein
MMENKNKNQLIWAQTVTVYGSKLTLHTTNFKKSWGLKFYEANRNMKTLKFQVANSKLPAILKLFIGCEIATWFYSNFFKSTNKSEEFNSINTKLTQNKIYKFFEKEKHGDYLSNIFTYTLLGKFLYFHNKSLTYSIFAIGAFSSLIFSFLNDKANKFADKNLKIEEFNLYSTQFNLIPKILLTSSILCGLNFFFKENYYLIKKRIPMNNKVIYMYIWAYIIAKMSRPLSNLTHDSMK